LPLVKNASIVEDEIPGPDVIMNHLEKTARWSWSNIPERDLGDEALPTLDVM